MSNPCECQDITIFVSPEGEDGVGIVRIILLTTVDKVKTYRIEFTNGTHFDYEVKDGANIASITLVDSQGLVDTYKVLLTDGTWTTFDVTNGMPCTHKWIGTTLEVTSASGTSSSDLKGDKGDTATIAVGTVTTGQPGTNASVENVGTANDGIFNFTIPRGDKGDKGDVMYATFEIDASTGILSMTTESAYSGPSFVIENGYLEVVI